MMLNKWQMYRAGLFNFWYYDDEQFYFADGKLLLRGLNGSGKSVTMQSLVTVLLDGKIAASRLDPFGSKDRRMEDYLLGEKDVVERDERTGYLFLEYKRSETDQYLTTGIGLRAKRGAALDFWGFVVTDNRRLGRELLLYKTEYSTADGAEERIPLTRAELEKAIGAGGQVVRTQQEYASLVNKYVFGFSSQDAYKDLMELLIQLRSPKLSKDFKPSVIHEILTESLPMLSDEELRPLADTIENIEQSKQQIEQMEMHKGAVQRLNRQYETYNLAQLAQKADELLKALQRSGKCRQQYGECEREISAQERSRQELAAALAEYEREQQVLRQEEVALREHDVFKAEQQRQAAEQQQRKLEQEYREKTAELAKKEKAERQQRDYIKSEQQAVDQAETQMLELLEEMAELAGESAYQGHALAVREFERSYSSQYSFELWQTDINKHNQVLSAVYRKLGEHTAAKLRQQAAEKELDEIRLALDMARQGLDKARQKFFAGRQELTDAFYRWVKLSEGIIPLSAEEIRAAAISLQGLYEETQWQDVLAPVDQACRRRQAELLREENDILHQIKLKTQDLRDNEAELAAWKQQKDPEPPRHAAVAAARQRLTEANIPFVPFYAGVEFRQSVSAADRERIEAALADMGLLDALIVPRTAIPQLDSDIADKIIQPEPAILAATLADYLYPLPPADSGIAAADIDEALRSILVEEGRTLTAFGKDPALSVRYGSYRNGLLSGRAPYNDQAIYIGREARRQFREQEMKRLERIIAGLEEGLAVLHEQRRGVLAAIDEVSQARENIPRPDQAYALFVEQEKAARDLAACEEEARRKSDRYRLLIEELKSLTDQLKQLAAGISLPLNEPAFEAALAAMNRYRDAFHALQLSYQHYTSGRKALSRAQDQLAEAMADVDRLKGECYVLDDAIRTNQLLLESITRRLEELGAEEIKQRSAEVLARLSELPRLIQNATRGEAEAAAAVQSLQNKLVRLQGEGIFLEAAVQCWERMLQQEKDLHLVEGIDELSAAEIVSRYGANLKVEERERIARSVTESFHRENAVLVEYRPVLEDMEFDIAIPPFPAGDSADALAWQTGLLEAARRRQRVILEYEGRKASPAAVLALLEKDIEAQRVIQSQQDRELYEEVILNSIGRIISKRIQNAEKWADQMNELMSNLNTSSGLAFSLRWKALTADKDEQMDTAELVELLRSDHRLLKEEDLMRVIRHFRSRIEQAKAASSGKVITFQQAVQEVLDFRRWFTFTLYYRREGMPKRELTNSAFGKFSGGEKAMAMYVPLFSAAYSRYREARADAPYIISLDEAFAGVDENNIREMFDLLEKLGFNYIMNSQSLWGDYDTVARLAIYELVRPKNAPFVTLIPYFWDGKVRRLMAEVS